MSGTSAPQVFLYFLSGAKKGKIESADAQVVRIGRQPYCEVGLDPHHDIPASGVHCHIIREPDGSYYLLDSQSTFGTYLNGTRITGRVKLSTGDVIECGKDAAGGREGPRLKFYLEGDIRKCAVCSELVYKKHYKCPDCRKKVCLRCVDEKHKVCKNCGEAREVAAQKAEAAGFEVVEDDTVRGKRPAKVVLKGKEAERLKRKKAKEAAREAAAGGEGMMPTLDVGDALGKKQTNIEKTLCVLCGEFVKTRYFVCPACQRPLCTTHQTGKVCTECAGIPKRPAARPGLPAPPTQVGPNGDGDGVGEGDEGVLAELIAPAPPAQPPARPAARSAATPPAVPPTVAPRRPTPGPGTAIPGDPSGSGRRSPGAPPPPPPLPALPPLPAGSAPMTPRLPDDSTADGVAIPETLDSPPGTPGLPSPTPSGKASCARCRGRLGPGTFACRSCHRVLCGAHQAVDDVCEDCYLAGLDKKLPPRPRTGKTPPPGAAIPGTLGPQRLVDRGRVERSLADTPPPPGSTRPPDFRTLELSPQDRPESPPSIFDSQRPPTLAEIEAMDMMPLLETEGDEDSNGPGGYVDPRVHTAETRRDFPVPAVEPPDELAPRPQSQASDGLAGLSFVCPHCDAPLKPTARACPKCRRAV